MKRAPAPPELRLFTRVRISADGIGACSGRIEDIREVSELPDTPLMPAELPRSILREWNVTRVALISFHAYPGQELIFGALEIGGRWYDLRRQELLLEVIGQPL
jgi:hypothetical protein